MGTAEIDWRALDDCSDNWNRDDASSGIDLGTLQSFSAVLMTILELA